MVGIRITGRTRLKHRLLSPNPRVSNSDLR